MRLVKLTTPIRSWDGIRSGLVCCAIEPMTRRKAFKVGDEVRFVATSPADYDGSSIFRGQITRLEGIWSDRQRLKVRVGELWKGRDVWRPREADERFDLAQRLGFRAWSNAAQDLVERGLDMVAAILVSWDELLVQPTKQQLEALEYLLVKPAIPMFGKFSTVTGRNLVKEGWAAPRGTASAVMVKTGNALLEITPLGRLVLERFRGQGRDD